MERPQKTKMNNGKNQRRKAPKPTNVWGNFYNLLTLASLRSYIGKKQQTNPISHAYNLFIAVQTNENKNKKHQHLFHFKSIESQGCKQIKKNPIHFLF